jgi:hypothetical protein
LAGVLAAAFFATTFFGAAFFAVDGSALAAFANRQRFFVAAMIRFIPSSLIRGLGFGASTAAGTDGSDSPLIAAHRFFWPAAIRRRAAAEILRFVEWVPAWSRPRWGHRPASAEVRQSEEREALAQRYSQYAQSAENPVSFDQFVDIMRRLSE